MKRFCILLLLLLIVGFANGQKKDSTTITSNYSFIIMDAPAQLFTMRQFNQSYLSGYRMLSRVLYSAMDNDYLVDMIQLGLESLFLMPLTHEEGHRSILTVNNIGSVSQPYFNKHGAAYVKGVTDQALQNLRDHNLPEYIRLHGGGLESDYMLTRRIEAIGSFDQDAFKHFKWEYWTRKYGILQYYVTGLFKFDIGIEEENDELERDIVGYDTYGAARHLHRPRMEFYRYTDYKDLTSEERNFVRRMGYRSLLNLVNPLIIGKNNFALTQELRFNFGMGYTMAPFGDFIDETLWLTYKDFNVEFYVRQFQNKTHWFPGFGVGLVDYSLTKHVMTTVRGHFWEQPENMDFYTSDVSVGGAVDVDFQFFFLKNNIEGFDGFSLDLGMIYKTEGFLPGELYMDEHFGIRLGTSVRL